MSKLRIVPYFSQRQNHGTRVENPPFLRVRARFTIPKAPARRFNIVVQHVLVQQCWKAGYNFNICEMLAEMFDRKKNILLTKNVEHTSSNIGC